MEGGICRAPEWIGRVLLPEDGQFFLGRAVGYTAGKNVHPRSRPICTGRKCHLILEWELFVCRANFVSRSADSLKEGNFQCPVWASSGVWGIGKKEAMWEKKRDGEEREERKKGEWELQLLNTPSVAITYFYWKVKIISHCFMFILMANT